MFSGYCLLNQLSAVYLIYATAFFSIANFPL